MIQVAAVSRLVAADHGAGRIPRVDEFPLRRGGPVGGDVLGHPGGGVGEDALPDPVRRDIGDDRRGQRSVSAEHDRVCGQAEDVGDRHGQVHAHLTLRGGCFLAHQQIRCDVGSFLVQRSVVFGEGSGDAVDAIEGEGGVEGRQNDTQGAHAVVKVELLHQPLLALLLMTPQGRLGIQLEDIAPGIALARRVVMRGRVVDQDRFGDRLIGRVEDTDLIDDHQRLALINPPLRQRLQHRRVLHQRHGAVDELVALDLGDTQQRHQNLVGEGRFLTVPARQALGTRKGPQVKPTPRRNQPPALEPADPAGTSHVPLEPADPAGTSHVPLQPATPRRNQPHPAGASQPTVQPASPRRACGSERTPRAARIPMWTERLRQTGHSGRHQNFSGLISATNR